MKKLLAILFTSSLFAACGDMKNSEQTTAGVPTEPVEIPAPVTDTLCFVRTDGIEHSDSTFVKLIINGNQVDGNMLWFPAEKDYRLGHIRGTYIDGIIKAGWIYVQEGQQQRLDVSFKLDGSTLMEKPDIVNPKLGIEELPDTGSYTKPYQPMDCSRFPDRLIRLEQLPDVLGQ